VNFVLTVCSQRIYLMKLLRSQGLPPKQLQTVFTALMLSHTTSQSHLTNQQRQGNNAFLKRARKSGFTETLYCIEVLLEKSDTRLFRHLKKPAHCIYTILLGNNKSHELLLGKEVIGIYLTFRTALITCI